MSFREAVDQEGNPGIFIEDWNGREVWFTWYQVAFLRSRLFPADEELDQKLDRRWCAIWGIDG